MAKCGQHEKKKGENPIKHRKNTRLPFGVSFFNFSQLSDLLDGSYVAFSVRVFSINPWTGEARAKCRARPIPNGRPRRIPQWIHPKTPGPNICVSSRNIAAATATGA